MFEKYGYFETAEEINKKATELLAAGDKTGVMELAKENGIEEEIADIFCSGSGEIDYICDDETAAIGKIDIEVVELQPQEIFKDWVEYIKASILKDKNIAIAVRKKDKSLKECISKILLWSFKNSYDVDKDIIKAAQKENKNIPDNIRLGIPGMGTVKKMIREYFLTDK
ncbi:MAG: hypothetical protein K2M73_10620 [Lachnospiraceae bacterium]|nr:hypothetical protein [Lachnospiraceae bacterium]